jgi:hypothetical protein
LNVPFIALLLKIFVLFTALAAKSVRLYDDLGRNAPMAAYASHTARLRRLFAWQIRRRFSENSSFVSSSY